MKVKIRRDDVLMSLDGVLYIEGRSGEKVAEVVKTNKRRALGMLRTFAPNLTARQVSVDSLGRVRINHPKYAEVARLMAADAKADGKAIGKVLSRRPRGPAPREFGGTVDFFCAGDGGVDIVCGDFDTDRDDCDVNGFCGWS